MKSTTVTHRPTTRGTNGATADPRVRIALEAIEILRSRSTDPAIWPPVQPMEPRVLEYLLAHAGSAETGVTSRQLEEALGTSQSVVQKAIVALPGTLLLAGISQIRIHRIDRHHVHGGHHYHVTVSAA